MWIEGFYYKAGLILSCGRLIVRAEKPQEYLRQGGNASASYTWKPDSLQSLLGLFHFIFGHGH